MTPSKADSAAALRQQAAMYRSQHRAAEALAALQRAIQLQPDDVQTLIMLATYQSSVGLLSDAAASIERAIALAPLDAEAHAAAGRIRQRQGMMDEAIANFRRAVELDPSNAVIGSNLLLALHYVEQSDCTAMFAEHVAWAKRHAPPRPACGWVHANDRDPQRRLRIAYISPDFRYHSVAHFLRGIIAGHDQRQFEVFCYADVTAADAWTEQFKRMNIVWHDTGQLDDRQLIEQMKLDAIDIAVDCAGHSSGNRLLALAHKPAPAQVTFLGYPDTTGLEAIDYRITDAVADPPGESEQIHTERLVRLNPVAWCYAAAADAPMRQPTRGDRPLTFGSFATLEKLTPRWAGVWCEVLRRTPGSRVVLKPLGMRDPALRQHINELFTAHGVEPGRIELLSRQPAPLDHLASYGQMDIALDTFPYHGTTTTCEAMYMGVPAVTMGGRPHVSRVGLSLLSAVGLQELIARDEAEFIELAAQLANHETRLRELHATLRQRMQASPLMDTTRYVAQLESAYRKMWQAWCG